MKYTPLPYHRISRPPRALRKARLDNIALVPASMLFHKAQYKTVANKLTTGSVLLVPPHQNKQRKILESVARFFQGQGHQVTMMPMEVMINKQAVT